MNNKTHLSLSFSNEDNLNGPVGIMVAAAKGVLRSLLCNGEFSGECIPVDFACNGIIAIAKSFCEMKTKPKDTPVFNITCHPEVSHEIQFTN